MFIMSGLADIISLIPDERPPETVTSSNALIAVQYNKLVRYYY